MNHAHIYNKEQRSGLSRLFWAEEFGVLRAKVANLFGETGTGWKSALAALGREEVFGLGNDDECALKRLFGRQINLLPPPPYVNKYKLVFYNGTGKGLALRRQAFLRA